MSQRGSRSSRERRSAAISESLEQDDEDEAIRAAMTNSHVRRGSMLSQKRWSSSEESNRPYSREIKVRSLHCIGSINRISRSLAA